MIWSGMARCLLVVTVLLSGWLLPAGIAADEAPAVTLPAGTILRGDSAERIKPSRLRPGDELLATLPRPVYSRDSIALGEGTRIKLVVDRVERMRAERERRGGWTGMLTAPFTRLAPRHRYEVVFRSAAVLVPDGVVIPIQPALIGVRDAGRVSAGNSKRNSPGSTTGVTSESAGSRRGSKLILRLDRPVTLSGSRDQVGDAVVSPPPETRARLLLLQPLSAARNHAGEVFLARLLEPLRLGNEILIPEGSTIEGRIMLQKPPRRLRRAGQMRLGFGKLNLPDGESAEVSASLVGVEALANSRLNLDEEGTLRARAATKKRAALDLGLAYVVGKVVDDVLEESVKAGVSAAATGTVTTVARYVGIGTGLMFFLAQKGRDVALPEYTELEIVIARPDGRAETPANGPPFSAD